MIGVHRNILLSTYYTDLILMLLTCMQIFFPTLFPIHFFYVQVLPTPFPHKISHDLQKSHSFIENIPGYFAYTPYFSPYITPYFAYDVFSHRTSKNGQREGRFFHGLNDSRISTI